MFTSRRAAAVLSVGALVLAACQPAAAPAPTSPPAVAAATTAPAAKPAAAASPAAAAASPAAPAASPAAAAAASPAAKPAASPAASPVAGTGTQPAAAAPESGCPNQPAAAGAKVLKVGLVTDVGKVDDKSFNQSAWEGVQCAQTNLKADVKFIETTDPKDYAKNIDQFAQDNYDVIITVGFALGDDTIAEAKKYPNIKFAGVDQFQADTVANLAGLTFDEDKAGYLAGYLAGSITKSGTIGQVLGTPIVPPVEKYGLGYINGAKAAKPGVKVLSACHPGGLAKGFTDPGWGNDTATQEMSQNADVIFAAGGQTGNGGLLAVASKGGTVLGIGVDTDQYLSLPEAKSILVSSAMKLITPGVFGIVKSVQDGSFKGGNVTGAVGLAPYHDLTARVPADVQTKMISVTAAIVAGTTKTGWDKPTANCPQG
ncbi:MAG TPA: BMP family ABC transporter substrate-binding protein [Chloroflexota bacterium]|nr:BMP family ABC transporter substrate-binding protein [Chloroflexota bacterium]